MITRAGLRAACGGRASLLASSRLAPRAASFAPRGPRVTSTEALHFSRPRLFSLRAAAGASGERAAPQWDIKVLYDGDCPLCMKEVRDRWRAGKSTETTFPVSRLVSS